MNIFFKKCCQLATHKNTSLIISSLIYIVLVVSDENRKLMESILAKSVQDQYEIGSRVATLLAGTSLTTTAGVDVKRRDPVEQIGYETVGKFADGDD